MLMKKKGKKRLHLSLVSFIYISSRFQYQYWYQEQKKFLKSDIVPPLIPNDFRAALEDTLGSFINFEVSCRYFKIASNMAKMYNVSVNVKKEKKSMNE